MKSTYWFYILYGVVGWSSVLARHVAQCILQDSSTAKALAFHKEVRTRCITLEGDDFNPGGLLTGTA
jgi:chromosome segregation ATPase